MIFRSKVDNTFKILIYIFVILFGIISFSPLLLFDNPSSFDIITLVLLFVVSTGLLFWTTHFIRYIFFQDHLYVKAGLFRSKIKYNEITKITKTKNFFTGYRLMAATDGIQIYYKSALLGSIKISPDDLESFISEIKKRCPNVKINL
ncbi:PH domain-containing protein [Oceanobacillus limi]|uniref:PH domain-containing protein n=1 Tax=Oceanobacillus limi TaxID=930131 RepID=A0A1I0GNQ5_9BACI|nr:PH domain-containing protein [Oceanobacillus limi]SET71888.1 PH domain-containing protein [Oceanobacillus limi]